MSKFRASTAPSPEDRLIISHLDKATQELEKALRVSEKVGSLRARKVARELGRLLSGLNEVGTIAPRYGEDPDSISEEKRTELFREKSERERKERLSKKQNAQVQSTETEEVSDE